MDISVYVINGLVLSGFIFLFIKDRRKTFKSLKAALSSFISLFPSLMILIIAIAVLFSFLPPGFIENYLGSNSGYLGVLSAAILGSILFLPAIIAFPLAGSLYNGGASVMVVAAFITTLTMIGFVTFPLEAKELGKKFALLRNGFSFIAAITISIIMGVVLK